MYGRNLPVRSTEEGDDDRQRRSHSSSRRSRERSLDPYQAVQSSGPDLTLSGHYPSAPGIAPAPMIVPSQRTAYPTHYSGTTSASAGPQIYASEYASTASPYGGGGGNLSSAYDVSAVDPSSLYPTSRARSTSGASADLSRSGSYYRAGSGRSSISPGEDESAVRVIHSRPKPQCWDHGCNGRQFSTFSNLLRHQRERAGTAAKPTCPHCGAEFTRTTARNGHMQHEKCRSRRGSND
ncbi:MAG: hypothetical protein M1812_001595 [Candelaria pacifica]|nr:MAG: hypothetical protein M1812_001595 [Candelaria pacifica]